MRESRSTHAAAVPDHILDELAQTLAEKIDVLLDRLTDRALAAPSAGTTAWRHQWLDRDSDTGREQQNRRRSIRHALASRTGIDLESLSSPTTSAAHPAPPAKRPRRTKRHVDTDQLCIF